MPNENVKIGSLRQASEIIELLQVEGPLGSGDIAKQIGIPHSTTYDYLNTLQKLEYLSKDDGRYFIGLKYLEHGANARMNYDIYEHCQPSLTQLAEKTEEAAWIVVEENGKGVYLENTLGERAIQTHAYVGKRSKLFHLASGKAMLSHYPLDQLRSIIYNEGTSDEQSIGDFFKELRNIREKGYALNDHAFTKGVRSVSTPIVVNEEVKGAISLSGPVNRLSNQIFDKAIEELLSAANEIELRIIS